MFGTKQEIFIPQLEMTDKQLFKLMEEKGIKRSKHKAIKKDFAYNGSMFGVCHNSKENRIEISRSVAYSKEKGNTYHTFAAFYYSVGSLRGDDWDSIMEFTQWLRGEGG